jgi:hypothetical protein
MEEGKTNRNPKFETDYSRLIDHAAAAAVYKCSAVSLKKEEGGGTGKGKRE